MIDPRFVYLAIVLSGLGGWIYIRDTLRGETSPNRVTWSLWGLEGVLAFGVEVQEHVGLASWMTLALGLVPFAVVAASFRNSHAVWKIGTFDIVCGSISVAGLIFLGFRERAHDRVSVLRLRRPGRRPADPAKVVAGSLV